MKFHRLHLSWIVRPNEFHFLIGLALGRVSYQPEARWLYSLRLFVGVARIELLWRTGGR